MRIPEDHAVYCQSAKAVLEALTSNAQCGLSSTESRARLELYGPNALKAEKPPPVWRRFVAQFHDPLVILLLVATGISATLWVLERGSALPYEAIAIFAVVLLNAVMGYAQRQRAEQAVAALRKMSAAHATAIRDGMRQRVAASELVPGDIILIEEGDTIPADARLIGMIDPPRAQAREAVTRAKMAGIRPIMITGDHPVTAAVIAAELGIVTDGRALTGAELESMSQEMLRRAVRGISVYARVNPGHKLRIVQALQEEGAIVAMTAPGEGVMTRRMWMGIVYVGVIMAAGTLLVLDASLPGGFIEGRGSLRYAQTMAFATLVLFSMFTVFNARSDEESAFKDLFSNPWLWAGVLLSLALQVAVIYVPFLQQAFSTEALTGSDWLQCCAVASSALWLRELTKLARRHALRRTSQTAPATRIQRRARGDQTS